MGAKREPNRLLAAAMQEAGLSNKALAGRVRVEAGKAGCAVSADHVSVRRWLDGARPRGETARCIAAALSTKLGRPISLTAIGLDTAADADIAQDGAAYQQASERSVDLLDNLTTADLAESPAVMKSGWVAAAAPGVITGYLFAAPLTREPSPPLEIAGAAEAAQIRATIRHLQDLDFQFGGGHTRKMLLFYWKSEIVPALRRRHHSDVTRREVFNAAADAAEVLGWSAYDAGRHGAAQRYFVQGLRLAREANDHVMGGQILSNLSHQANYLGNFSEAVQFARAAQAATVGKASATVTAMFLAMEARALASIGDARGCTDALHRAEQEFERRNPSADPDWISYFDALELAGEAAHCFRDLGRSRETQLFATQAIEPTLTPPRTRAFIGMVSAAGALNGGNLDEAVSLATDAVNLAGALQSNRYVQYVSDFYQSLTQKYGTHSSVRAFVELVQASYPTVLTLRGA